MRRTLAIVSLAACLAGCGASPAKKAEEARAIATEGHDIAERAAIKADDLDKRVEALESKVQALEARLNNQ